MNHCDAQSPLLGRKSCTASRDSAAYDDHIVSAAIGRGVGQTPELVPPFSVDLRVVGVKVDGFNRRIIAEEDRIASALEAGKVMELDLEA